MAYLSYQFTVPFEYDVVSKAIFRAASLCNSSCSTTYGGEFNFKIVPSFGSFAIKFVLYLSETDGICTLRITSKGTDNQKVHFKAYDKFLNALEESGISIPVVPGDPYIVSASMIGDGTEQRFANRMGGVATNIATAKVKTVLSTHVSFSIYYSNGMIKEETVKRNSKLYSELIAKLNANPVIKKYK